jgi:putative peptide zinc metalloprotease protein
VIADATGVPDLYAHMGPTLRRLVPWGERPASALRGRARLLVTAWVLVIVPILLSFLLSVVLLLPRLLASTWASGSVVASELSAHASSGDVVPLLVDVLRVFGLALPLLGASYIAWRLARGAVRRAATWSGGRPARRAVVLALGLVVAGLLVWAWWPDGQYEPIRASDRGSLLDAHELVASSAPSPAATSQAEGADEQPAPVEIPPGTYVGVTLIPQDDSGGEAPVVTVITDPTGDDPPIIIASPPSSGGDASGDAPPTTTATAFTFAMPDAPGEGDSQALAVNRTDGGITYDIVYSLVTVRDGEDVDQRNEAYAFANCNACTTVAVSFQVVLVVGESQTIAPINIAEALNGNCPYCVTAAIAQQIVISIGSEPSDELIAQLRTELERLDALAALGTSVTPTYVVDTVMQVQQGVNQVLADAGLLEGVDDPAGAPPTDGSLEEPTAEETTAPGETSAGASTTDAGTADASSTDPATTDPTATDGTGDPSTATSTSTP